MGRDTGRDEDGAPTDGWMWELSIPLRAPFTSATGRITERRVIVVSVTDGSVVGWGEAAPYPGVTSDTVDDAWESLRRGSVLSPTAAAALDEATADLDARREAMPLWRSIGGSRRSVPTSVAVGLDEDPVERIEETSAAGVKLKIRPGNDLARVAAVRSALPDVAIGVDANGSYRWEDRDALLELDGLGVDYVEQPFPRDDFAAHARLRDELIAAVALDEPIDSTTAAIRGIEADACDLVVVKPGRLGLAAARTIHDIALAAGLRIKSSGLLETDVGRAHTLAIASLPAAVHSDVAAANWFLEAAFGGSESPTDSGSIDLSDRPGIGFDPDPRAFAPYVVREAAMGSGVRAKP